MHALTGWIPERISIKQNDAEFNKNAVFDRLKLGLEQGRCLITVATGDLTDFESDRTGLVSTHAYAVLDIKEVDVSLWRFFMIIFLYKSILFVGRAIGSLEKPLVTFALERKLLRVRCCTLDSRNATCT